MNHARTAAARSWRRGSMFGAFLALALFFATGCSTEADPTAEPAAFLSPVADTTPMNLAPDFCPSLPSHEVVVKHNQPGDGTLFGVWFWGIGSGYDLTDGTWPGWCLEDNDMPNVTDPGRVTTFCSYDDALPGNLSDLPINELNYLLNHRTGTYQEIQAAIWLLTWGSSTTFEPTDASLAMLEDALDNGAGFVPGPGDLVAIILYTGDGGIGPEGYQDTIVELRLPGEPEEPEDPADLGACTPGYWRNHGDRWPEDYSPGDEFDEVFGTDYFAGGYSLGNAIWAQGGQVGKLARHGTAALLNAAHGEFEYRYSVEEVIEAVRNGDAQMLADANEEYECPLGGTRASRVGGRRR